MVVRFFLFCEPKKIFKKFFDEGYFSQKKRIINSRRTKKYKKENTEMFIILYDEIVELLTLLNNLYDVLQIGLEIVISILTIISFFIKDR